MSRERQQKQSEETKRRILEVARGIVSREGPDALSIRRITDEMEYSPGSLYHYFRSKEELLQQLLLEGYRRILESIGPPAGDLPPEQAVTAAIRGYVQGVLRWPEEYRAVMFSGNPDILRVTSVLDVDVREKRSAMDWLASTIECGVSEGVFLPCDPTLTAQALWCAMFGLVARLIVEPVSEERKDLLMEAQITLILKGILI